jgi:hypothetical protein
MRLPPPSMLQSLQSVSSTIPFNKLSALVFVMCLSAVSTLSQPRESRIKISIDNPPELSVTIEQSTPTSSWSFKNAYAGTLGLGERIEKFRVSRASESVQVKTIATGEFRSEGLAESVSYVVRVTPHQKNELAHVSWLAKDYGLLMLADLLPVLPGRERGTAVEFELPEDWLVYSSVMSDRERRFSLDDLEKAVFFVGRGLRSNSKRVRDIEFKVITNIDWNFSDKSLLNSAARVLERYFELTGFKLRGKPTILLAPFPGPDSSSEWKAETRGSTLVLLLNSQAQVKNWMGLLGVIFTHELFHLWVPNSLALNGDYDWFFEGFTLYIALQEALSLKLIGFQEYLDTLGRVYDSYRSQPDNHTLLEASERRWTSSSSAVYDRGMLVAFIYDLILKRESNGKQTVRDLYRSLFAKFADKPANANDVIIGLLTSLPATSNFARSFIETRDRIELEKILPAFGIKIDSSLSQSHVSVLKELSDEQKKLLRSLGYRK